MKSRTRSTAARKKTSAGGTLIGLFIGLVIGVLIAAGVVWYIYKTPMPLSSKSQQPASTSPQPPAASQGGTPSAPLALPGKPGDPIPSEPTGSDKARFDFYKILPGNGEAVPDSKPAAGKPESGELKQADEAKGKDAKDSLLKEPLFLQTGSFQNASDADNHKAKLAMMGVEASIQQVMLQDKVWYRVRLGPFRKLEDVNNMRSELAKQGIEASVVKQD